LSPLKKTDTARMRLVRRYCFWGIALSLVSMALSMTCFDSFEQRVVISALFVAAGFLGAAVNGGPLYGILAGFIVLVGALLGAIAFSWSVGAVVAIIGVLKLHRMNVKNDN
jgi:hypothetical protein